MHGASISDEFYRRMALEGLVEQCNQMPPDVLLAMVALQPDFIELVIMNFQQHRKLNEKVIYIDLNDTPTIAYDDAIVLGKDLKRTLNALRLVGSIFTQLKVNVTQGTNVNTVEEITNAVVQHCSNVTEVVVAVVGQPANEAKTFALDSDFPRKVAEINAA